VIKFKIGKVDQFSLFDWKKSEVTFVILVLLGIFGISFYQLKIGEMKTRDLQRRSDVDLVSRAVRKYRSDNGVFPLEATGSGKIYACGDKGEGVCEWNGGPLVGPDNTVYLNKLPGDPWDSRGRTYVYETDQKREHFRVYAGLENRRDPVIKPGLTRECGVRVQCNWYAEE
jgi:hypothetical protein